MKKKKKEKDVFKDLGEKKKKEGGKRKKKHKPGKHRCSLKKQRLLEVVHILWR